MATSLHTDQAVKHLLHSYMRTMEDQMSQLGPEDYKHLHASEQVCLLINWIKENLQGKVIRELGYKVPLSSYASASHKLKEMIGVTVPSPLTVPLVSRNISISTVRSIRKLIDPSFLLWV